MHADYSFYTSTMGTIVSYLRKPTDTSHLQSADGGPEYLQCPGQSVNT